MMRRRLFLSALLAAAPVVALSAQDAPESLLPPGFGSPATDTPSPAPSPTVEPTSAPAPSAPPSAPAPQAAPTAGPSPTPRATSSPVIQPVPGGGGSGTAARLDPIEAQRALLERLPSLDELEAMDPDELDELLGLKPKFDIPPGAQRSTERVGLLAESERGMPTDALASYSGRYVGRVLAGTQGPLVSRWGHILLRRALVSRMVAPAGMDGVHFAALRAALLNRIGEGPAARALVQEVDTGNYSPALIAAAYDAYVATGDFTGACPMVQLHGASREDGEWELLRGICSTYAGEARGMARIDRLQRRREVPRIDALLAQKYAGAVGRSRRAVTLEWDEVEELTEWRYGLATATGAEVPESLIVAGGRRYQLLAATAPSVGLVARARGADAAAAAGILSATALVDLYSQIYADQEITGEEAARAAALREAYVGEPAARMAAMRRIWGDAGDPQRHHSRQVLTAYAAARLPVSEELAGDAGSLITSMLTAGLDRNAMRWANVVEAGSQGWALLALASPDGGSASPDAVRSYIDGDASDNGRRSAFLVAGLAGLGRLSAADAAALGEETGADLSRRTRWTRAMEMVAQRRNQPLAVFLAALGMQGSGWDKMTPLHLYHITATLRQAGLEAEARMIAAEAVARG